MQKQAILGKPFDVPGQYSCVLTADEGHNDEVFAVYTPVSNDTAHLEWKMPLSEAIEQGMISAQLADGLPRYSREETYQYFRIADPMLI